MIRPICIRTSLYRRKEKDLRLLEWVVDYTWTVYASCYRQYVAILMFVSKSFSPLTRLISDPIRMWDDDGPKMCSQASILGLLTLFVYTLCLELTVSLILPLSLSMYVCMYMYTIQLLSSVSPRWRIAYMQHLY